MPNDMFLEMRGWKHSFDLVPMLQRGNRLKYLIEFIEIAAGATRSALPRGSMGTRKNHHGHQINPENQGSDTKNHWEREKRENERCGSWENALTADGNVF